MKIRLSILDASAYFASCLTFSPVSYYVHYYNAGCALITKWQLMQALNIAV